MPFSRCSRLVDSCTGTETEAGYAEGEYTPVVASSLADAYDVDFLGGVDTEYIDGDVLLECSAFVGECLCLTLFRVSSLLFV